jgi:hypothetical protein
MSYDVEGDRGDVPECGECRARELHHFEAERALEQAEAEVERWRARAEAVEVSDAMADAALDSWLASYRVLDSPTVMTETARRVSRERMRDAVAAALIARTR